MDKASFLALDAERVTPDWILERIDRFGLTRRDVWSALGFDSSQLSLFLTGKRPLSKSVRRSFFYFFLALELAQRLEEQDGAGGQER